MKNDTQGWFECKVGGSADLLSAEIGRRTGSPMVREAGSYVGELLMAARFAEEGIRARVVTVLK